ncbi:MAG: DNA polymerase III subunit chi [Gammaproteobacteria bacterium]|nr:DNA polymerase III subunit chi [Gammaproteobacteria bacterium]
MTQVDFYILNNAGLAGLENYTCKLVEKAFHRGHRIFILTANQDQSERLNKLLWTFNDRSFVPHVLAEDDLASDTPIHISHLSRNTSINDVLVNLKPELVENFDRFSRIAEIVGGDDQQKQAARMRYREYQKHQCQVATHEVNR